MKMFIVYKTLKALTKAFIHHLVLECSRCSSMSVIWYVFIRNGIFNKIDSWVRSHKMTSCLKLVFSCPQNDPMPSRWPMVHVTKISLIGMTNLPTETWHAKISNLRSHCCTHQWLLLALNHAKLYKEIIRNGSGVLNIIRDLILRH